VVGTVPRRSLVLISGLSGLTLTVAAVTGLDRKPLVLLITGSFAAVYVFGTASAVRLLPRGSWVQRFAMVALVVVAALLLMTRWYMVWPMLVGGGALLYLRLRRPRGGGTDGWRQTRATDDHRLLHALVSHSDPDHVTKSTMRARAGHEVWG
jgi:hypothetical protein